MERRTNLEAALISESLDLVLVEVESDDGSVRRATVKRSSLVRPVEREEGGKVRTGTLSSSLLLLRNRKQNSPAQVEDRSIENLLHDQ